MQEEQMPEDRDLTQKWEQDKHDYDKVAQKKEDPKETDKWEQGKQKPL